MRRRGKPRPRAGTKRRRIGSLSPQVARASSTDTDTSQSVNGTHAKRIVSRDSLALDLAAMKKDGGCIVQRFIKTLHLNLFDSIPYDLVRIMVSYALDFQIVFLENHLTEITSVLNPDVRITTSLAGDRQQMDYTTLHMTWKSNHPDDFKNEGFLVNDQREAKSHPACVRFDVRINVPTHPAAETNVLEDREYSLVRTIVMRVVNGQVQSFYDPLVVGSIVTDHIIPVFTTAELSADHVLVKSLDLAFPSIEIYNL